MDARNVRRLLRYRSSTPKSTALAMADADDQDGLGFYEDCRGDRPLPSSDGKVPVVEGSEAERKLSRQELRFCRRSMDLLRRMQDYQRRDGCHVFQARAAKPAGAATVLLEQDPRLSCLTEFHKRQSEVGQADAILAIFNYEQGRL